MSRLADKVLGRLRRKKTCSTFRFEVSTDMPSDQEIREAMGRLAQPVQERFKEAIDILEAHFPHWLATPRPPITEEYAPAAPASYNPYQESYLFYAYCFPADWWDLDRRPNVGYWPRGKPKTKAAKKRTRKAKKMKER
jgi:hypothetical protein